MTAIDFNNRLITNECLFPGKEWQKEDGIFFLLHTDIRIMESLLTLFLIEFHEKSTGNSFLLFDWFRKRVFSAHTILITPIWIPLEGNI